MEQKRKRNDEKEKRAKETTKKKERKKVLIFGIILIATVRNLSYSFGYCYTLSVRKMVSVFFISMFIHFLFFQKLVRIISCT